MEADKGRDYSPYEDTREVKDREGNAVLDKNGHVIRVNILAGAIRSDPGDQALLGYSLIENYNLVPQQVMSWVTETDQQDHLKLLCIGRNIDWDKDLSEDQKEEQSKRILKPDADLIDKLSPYLTRAEMSRILTLRKYRGADEALKHTIYSGSYRLLGDYLGPRRYYNRDRERVAPLTLPDLPAEIYNDDLISEILVESQRQATEEYYNLSSESCFEYLDSLRQQATIPEQLEFIQKVEAHFRGSEAFEIPAGFKREIAGSQRDIPEAERTQSFSFPSNHQRGFAYRFVNKKDLGPVDLLDGGTGTQKTRGALLAMRAASERGLGGERPIIFCPSGIPVQDWVNEINDSIEEKPNVVVFKSVADLKRYVNTNHEKKPDYTIIGYGLLSALGINKSSFELFEKLKEKIDYDGLIADEAHLLNNIDANCTELVHFISRQLSEKTPRIAMSATLVVNTVEDLDSPVRILLPNQYPNSGDFTKALRNEPYLISAMLYGKGLITRWPKEKILRGKLPELNKEIDLVPLSIFHQRLYDFVHEDNLPEGRTKRQILMQLSLDPLLIKKYYSPEGIKSQIEQLRARQQTKQDEKEVAIIGRMIEGLEERARRISSMISLDGALDQLSQAYEQFVDWKLTQDPKVVFDEDFLVQIGFDTLALWSFFNLPKSMDSLVGYSNDRFIREAWTGKEGLYSSKYRYLKEKYLDRLVAEGKSKIRISSGVYKTSVTTANEEDSNLVADLEADDEEVFRSLFDHLRAWYGPDRVLRIDGDVSAQPKRGEMSERESVKTQFRMEPEKTIILTTVRSSRLGINMTIPPIQRNTAIEKVYHFSIDDPETQADKEQDIGRGDRPGQLIPNEHHTLIAAHADYPNVFRYSLVDQARAEALEYKRLISQMTLDCIPLTEEEEEFVRAHMRGVRIQNLYPETPRMYMINRFFPSVRGKGYDEVRRFLGQIGFEGLSNADFFAVHYPENDENSLAGHNAKVVSEIIKTFEEQSNRGSLRVGSIGAGAGILQAILGRPIVNVDMIEEITQVAKQRNAPDGHFIVGNAHKLPFRDNVFGATDDSLALHWSNPKERPEIFRELNRITETGGLVTFSLPHSYLTSEQFIDWKDTLEGYFGLRLSNNLPSGLVRATDFRPEPISWIFNFIKVGRPTEGYDSSKLMLDFEKLDGLIEGEKNGRDGNHAVVYRPSLPHKEFEIIQPLTEDRDIVIFGGSGLDEEIERFLNRRGSYNRQEFSNLLLSTGLDEQGMHRRLMKDAIAKWGISLETAQELSLRALTEYAREPIGIYNVRNMWSVLRSILIDLYEGQNGVENGRET